MKNIIVIFGGVSPEHDVSIVTGCLAVNSLDKSKFNPVPVYVNKHGEWFTGDKLFKLGFFKEYSEKKLSRVFLIAGENVLYRYSSKKAACKIAGAVNCMHGGSGENGTIGALFDLCGIPSTSTGLFSAAAAMDKDFTKIVLSGIGVNCLPHEVVLREDFYKKANKIVQSIADKLKFPVIVKPSGTGSSIGISVAETYEQLYKSLVLALRYDEKAIVEPFIKDFIEINCAAYRKNGTVMVSELERPLSNHSILTFEDKYLGAKGGMVKREFPADLPENISKEIKETTKKIYVTIGFSSVVRIDYIVKDEKVYLNEINSVPGSLSYYLFYNRISEITDLLTDLLDEAFKKRLSKQGSLSDYESDVLSFKGIALKK